MKKLKFFVLTALLCAGTLITSSCGDDEEDNPVPNNNGTENPSGGNGSGTENSSDVNGTETPSGGDGTETTKTPTFTVIFDSDGGSVVQTQTVDKDGKANKPADPTKDGFTFKGWNNGSVPYDFSTSVIADLTLKAIWEKVKKFYTVVFDTDGGTSIDVQTVEEGGKVNRPADPTKDGYNFVQWNLGSTPYDFSAAVTADITIRTIWKEIAKPDPSVGFATLPGVFTVSDDGKQVRFASGNLLYQPSTQTWCFAPSQLYSVGINNGYIADVAYEGWIDLFGWGTGDAPTKLSSSNTDYSTFTDWGKNIGDGITWYTLSYDEWHYIFHTRQNASEKRGLATVDGVNGYILLPDAFALPAGLIFNSGVASLGGATSFKTVNDYTADQWSKMESAGAVFLPAAGDRYDSSVVGVDYHGNYWTSAPGVVGNACYVFFSPTLANSDNNYSLRRNGLSVRLVSPL